MTGCAVRRHPAARPYLTFLAAGFGLGDCLPAGCRPSCPSRLPVRLAAIATSQQDYEGPRIGILSSKDLQRLSSCSDIPGAMLPSRKKDRIRFTRSTRSPLLRGVWRTARQCPVEPTLPTVERLRLLRPRAAIRLVRSRSATQFKRDSAPSMEAARVPNSFSALGLALSKGSILICVPASFPERSFLLRRSLRTPSARLRFRLDEMGLCGPLLDHIFSFLLFPVPYACARIL